MSMFTPLFRHKFNIMTLKSMKPPPAGRVKRTRKTTRKTVKKPKK